MKIIYSLLPTRFEVMVGGMGWVRLVVLTGVIWWIDPTVALSIRTAATTTSWLDNAAFTFILGYTCLKLILSCRRDAA
jgi:hypothetical protein